jgi:hypothetical protein
MKNDLSINSDVCITEKNKILLQNKKFFQQNSDLLTIVEHPYRLIETIINLPKAKNPAEGF